MTDLRKPVTRKTVGIPQSLRHKIVVSLMPGDVIAMKELGGRRWYSAPIGRVFTYMVRTNVEAQRRG